MLFVLPIFRFNQALWWHRSLLRNSDALQSCILGFPEIFNTQAPYGLPVRIAPLINIPKGFSSKMTLEVAKIALKVSTQYMLETHVFTQFNAVCTKIMPILINLFTVCKALSGIFMHKGLK